MARVKKIHEMSDTELPFEWAFDCPGCGMWHSVAVDHKNANGGQWGFNGDVERPTFTPSILVRWPLRIKTGVVIQEQCCHSFVRDGMIQFLEDCTHGLKGKTIDLPQIDPPAEKLKIALNVNPATGRKFHHTQYLYYCYGCGCLHAFALKQDGGNHEFNGDLFTPTVYPSILFGPANVCHHYIKNGMIQYLPDCFHKMAGHTLPLPDINIFTK